MKESKSENSILLFLKKLVTNDLQMQSGDTYATRNPTDFFCPKHNETVLAPEGNCWYGQAKLLEVYHEWLNAENVPQRFRKGKTRLLTQLKKHGLRMAKVTDRAFHHNQDRYAKRQWKCWYICKHSVRELHRTWLNNPDWDY